MFAAARSVAESEHLEIAGAGQPLGRDRTAGSAVLAGAAQDRTNERLVLDQEPAGTERVGAQAAHDDLVSGPQLVGQHPLHGLHAVFDLDVRLSTAQSAKHSAPVG